MTRRAGRARGLREQAAEPTRRGGDEHDVAGLERATSRIAIAVRPVPIIATATSSGMPSGSACRCSASRTASSA